MLEREGVPELQRKKLAKLDGGLLGDAVDRVFTGD